MGQPATPWQVLLDGGQPAEEEHRRGTAEPDAEHHEHEAPAAADAERAVGDAHEERLAPEGLGPPAIHDEPERTPALVEASVADRAELPEPGDEERRPHDQLGVLGQE